MDQSISEDSGSEPKVNKTQSEQNTILDLSKKGFKKVPKQEGARNVKVLILDENELQKIDNIDSYLKIEKLSLCKNNLLRMFGVSRLHLLQELHLADNGILTIEGLKDLVHLKHLNLKGNCIKTIEHINTNLKLEHLNLSENNITAISDISFLKNLKELYLHGNRVTHLKQCDRYLPISLQTLTLAFNHIADLNEICTLSGLTALNSFSIQENPCVQMTGENVGFDYRPFVLNWCMTVKVIDGYVVNPIESLKAEWLYSQGRGRQFRLGEQVDLAKYLSSVCPMTADPLENEDDRKLRLILSKAQQHQRQLKEEISEGSNTSAANSPSSGRRRGASNRIQSPRFSRLSRPGSGSPDSMSSSYHGNTSSSSVHNDANTLIQMSTSLIENVNNDQSSIMVQSLDPNILSASSRSSMTSSIYESNASRSIQLNEQQTKQGPLVSATKMVPVPETLMSPDCPPNNAPAVQHKSNLHSNTSTPNNKVSAIKIHKESKLASPKISRTSISKRQEKSPVLNVRKNNSINAALKANQNAASVHHAHHSDDNILSATSKTHKNLVHSASPPPPALIPVHQTTAQLSQSMNRSYSATPDNMSTVSSDDDSDHINVEKLKTIRSKAAQRSQEQQHHHHHPTKDNADSSILNKTRENSTEDSAIIIQKIWRGYNIRKQNKYLAEPLQQSRTQHYIEKLTQDMETTKVALENERKIQQLQMQAINALWKKVSTMQPTTNNIPDLTAAAANLTVVDNNSAAVVQDLAKTCSVLTNQVQQLQGSMRDILECMTVFCKAQQLQQQNHSNMTQSNTAAEVKDSSATQTEIVAVHTPQVENLPFPFVNKLQRPSTLSLGDSSDAGNRQPADSDVSKHKIDEEERTEASSDNEKNVEELISKSSRDETPENTEKDQRTSGEDNAKDTGSASANVSIPENNVNN